MRFFGKELSEHNKGYFGVRRCTICKDTLRDVDLVEICATNYFCCIPTRASVIKRILVCQHCNAFMEIDNKLWEYYSTYYSHRFNKNTTDKIINTLKNLSDDIAKNNVELSIGDETSQKALDLIFKGLCDKYGTPENVEEIVSVYYK